MKMKMFSPNLPLPMNEDRQGSLSLFVMTSPLPVINTVLLIANLAIAGFTIDNSTKILESQNKVTQKIAVKGNGDLVRKSDLNSLARKSDLNSLVRKSDLDSAVRKITGDRYGFIESDDNLVNIKESIESIKKCLKFNSLC